MHGASQKVGQLADPLFLDRIDIQCEISALPFKELSKAAPGEPSAKIRERVIAARALQTARFKDVPGVHCNAQMTERMSTSMLSPMSRGSTLCAWPWSDCRSLPVPTRAS